MFMSTVLWQVIHQQFKKASIFQATLSPSLGSSWLAGGLFLLPLVGKKSVMDFILGGRSITRAKIWDWILGIAPKSVNYCAKFEFVASLPGNRAVVRHEPGLNFKLCIASSTQ